MNRLPEDTPPGNERKNTKVGPIDFVIQLISGTTTPSTGSADALTGSAGTGTK